MARKRYKPEEIVAKLRQVDVLVSRPASILLLEGSRSLRSKRARAGLSISLGEVPGPSICFPGGIEAQLSDAACTKSGYFAQKALP
jgi:hypothetical protein